MMNLTVDLWPGGFTDNKREMGRIALANVSHLYDVSNYVVAVEDQYGIKFMFIKGHKRGDGFWVLYVHILKMLVGDIEWVDVPEKYSEYLTVLPERMHADSA